MSFLPSSPKKRVQEWGKSNKIPKFDTIYAYDVKFIKPIKDMFSKEIYTKRRAELRQRIQSGIILLPGNQHSPNNYPNNAYYFRQDSTFLYYFASDYEGLAAVIDVDNDKEIIFGDELTIDSIVWTGVQPTIKEKSERVGIEETRPFAEFATYVKNAQAKGQEIHFLPPYRGEHQVWLQELLGINPAEQEAKASLKFIKACKASFSVSAMDSKRS